MQFSQWQLIFIFQINLLVETNHMLSKLFLEWVQNTHNIFSDVVATAADFFKTIHSYY